MNKLIAFPVIELDNTVQEYPADPLELTPEQVGELHDRNETFCGKRPNTEKIALFYEIRSDLQDFLQKCDEVVQVSGFAPNKNERHALLYMDVKQYATFDQKGTALLTAVMNKADSILVNSKGENTRFCFAVKDVWTD